MAGCTSNARRPRTTAFQGSSYRLLLVLGAWLLQLPASPGNCQPLLITGGLGAGPDGKVRPGAILACDPSAGKWQPKERPYYNGSRCATALFHDKFGCKHQLEGRGYERWRWQPAACTLPAATRVLLDRLLAGRRMLLVGDSMLQNLFASLACLLMEEYSSEGVQVGRSDLAVSAAAKAASAAAAVAGEEGARRQYWARWRERELTFNNSVRVPSANFMMEHYPSPYLVEPRGAMDQVDRSWLDVLDLLARQAVHADGGVHAGGGFHAGGGDSGGSPAARHSAAGASSQLLVIGVGHWLTGDQFLVYRGAATPQRGNFTATTAADSGSSSSAAAPGAFSNQSNSSSMVPEVDLDDYMQALLAVMAAVRRELARRAFRGPVFWLTQTPYHHACDAVSVDFEPHGSRRYHYLREHHDVMLRMHEAEAVAARDAGWQLLDITKLSALRPDAHMAYSASTAGAFNHGKDCLHWCLGGVPDTWVEVLLLRLQELQEAVARGW